MSNTEILNEMSTIEIGNEYLSVDRRLACVHSNSKKIHYNLLIEGAINRALSVSNTVFKIFFLLIYYYL